MGTQGYKVGIVKISPAMFVEVCLRSAEAMETPGAWTDGDYLAVDAAGRSVDLYSDEVAARDGMGWILKVGKELRGGSSSYDVGHLLLQYVDSGIRILTANRERLYSINEKGPEATAKMLRAIAKAFGQGLPDIYTYVLE